MKFNRINGEYPIVSVEIIDPTECPGIKYYYPDGQEYGIFKKKTYFVGVYDHFLRTDTKYETLEEANKEAFQGKNFVKNGKIWIPGKIKFKFDYEDETVFEFRGSKELIELLDNFSFKYGFPLGYYVSLETSETESLYEFKEKLTGNIER